MWSMFLTKSFLDCGLKLSGWNWRNKKISNGRRQAKRVESKIHLHSSSMYSVSTYFRLELIQPSAREVFIFCRRLYKLQTKISERAIRISSNIGIHNISSSTWLITSFKFVQIPGVKTRFGVLGVDNSIKWVCRHYPPPWVFEASWPFWSGYTLSFIFLSHKTIYILLIYSTPNFKSN